MVVTKPVSMGQAVGIGQTPLTLGILTTLLLYAVFFCSNSHAAVLAEDRADALFHAYDGGGINVNGPSILVRKGYKDKVSVFANYYQDVISSASIDVLVSGSKYGEKRDEFSMGVDYLVDKTTLSLSGGNSTESDYIADSISFGISQEFFGDMSTLSLGYAYGEDTIMRNGEVPEGEEEFRKYAQRKRFSIGFTQVLTKSWIMAMSFETVVDAGFLNNSYRSYHYRETDSLTNREVRKEAFEIYPETHNSDAFAIRTMYYLPYRASIRLEARVFTDSWGIEAQNFEIRYTHPIRERILLEVKARAYSQTQADFYSDLFDYANAFDFMGRDKELSTYTSNNFGVGVTYDFKYKLPFAEKQSFSLFWDLMLFNYENFRNACDSQQCEGESAPEYIVGQEPTYAFSANIFRAFFSVYY